MIIDNGILQITIANPEGYLTGIRYAGVENLLETRNKASNRGYENLFIHSTLEALIASFP